MGAPGLATLPPLSLYVHLPWCVRKCPYCDFNSHEVSPRATGLSRIAFHPSLPEASGPALEPALAQWLEADLQARYVAALLLDLEQALPLIWGRSVQTVFLGGGTPSLFDPLMIERLIDGLRARLRLAPHAEITMEANPGTFEQSRFRDYRSAGINRLSIGVQSFNAQHLQALGRIHDPAQALAAAELAAQVYPSFNLDVMYGLPGQSLQQCQEDLSTAMRFSPPHLSMYHLTLEPNTLFARFPPELPDDDLCADMQLAIDAATGQAGLEHYEISAYARPGHRAQHNLNYWSFGDYLGIGAGAHSKLSFHDRIVRQARLKNPRAYLQALDPDHPASAVEIDEPIAPQSMPFEFMLNALRLIEGVPASLYQERTGQWPTGLQHGLKAALHRGLLCEDPLRLQASSLGLRFLNDLQQMFLET
jgi:putative oxygen-independent coproporphyrinogen III oxidase